MKTIEDLLKAHAFFRGLEPKYIAIIAGCGKNLVYKENEFLAREGDAANQFFVVRQGRVAINILSVHEGPMLIQTLQEGDILGWSWIIEPYFWRFDAKALEATHVIALDGKCLRGKCEKDPKLGYELLKRFSSVLAQRLEMARFQMLDIYGPKNQERPAHGGK